MEAFSADSSVEEETLIYALTDIAGRIIRSAYAATLTVEGSLIVKGTRLALDASLTVQERFLGGTEDAGVLIEVIHPMCRARRALF